MKEAKDLSSQSGDIYAEPGLFHNVRIFDEESLHPTAIGDLSEEQKAHEMEKLRLVMEVNAVIEAVKSGEMEGECFEF